MSWDAADTFAVIQALEQRHGRSPTIAQFLEERRHRLKQGIAIPTLQTLYARYGSWADLVRAAGVPYEKSERSPLDDCLASLVACADAIGKDQFTSTEYDSWRAGSTRHRSSSVIRKWFGPWAKALEALAEEQERLTSSLLVSPGTRSRLSPLAA